MEKIKYNENNLNNRVKHLDAKKQIINILAQEHVTISEARDIFNDIDNALRQCTYVNGVAENPCD